MSADFSQGGAVASGEPDFASLSGDGYGFHLDWKRPHPEWDAAA